MSGVRQALRENNEKDRIRLLPQNETNKNH
jgi:hypothetical protein